MEYIVHRRCREKAMTGKDMNIPYGTKLTCEGLVIKQDGESLCFCTSENAHRYFARNDDGQGLRRGALTYAIAYAKRERTSDDGLRRQRFTDREIKMLCSYWSHFLVKDVPVILFNHDFFNADVESLERMADALDIRVKE